MYTEQFLSKLLVYIFTPNKIFDQNFDENMIVQIRAAALTLLAVLSSYHEDIKKRIAEQESKRRIFFSNEDFMKRNFRFNFNGN
jgi:hypothetical protein